MLAEKATRAIFAWAADMTASGGNAVIVYTTPDEAAAWRDFM